MPWVDKDWQEDLGEYDPTTWKLVWIKQFMTSHGAGQGDSFKVQQSDQRSGQQSERYPKDDEALQRILQSSATACKDSNPAERQLGDYVLKFQFNWADDPVNADYVAKDLAQRSFDTTRHQVASCWAILQSCLWLALFVYLGWVVLGSFDAIADKRAHMGKARDLLWALFVIDVVLDGLVVALEFQHGFIFFGQIYLACFVAGKFMTFLVVIHVDNLNDVVQAGGDGTEKLSASQLQGKLINEETALLGAAAVVGEVVKVDDAAMPPV